MIPFECPVDKKTKVEKLLMQQDAIVILAPTQKNVSFCVILNVEWSQELTSNNFEVWMTATNLGMVQARVDHRILWNGKEKKAKTALHNWRSILINY